MLHIKGIKHLDEIKELFTVEAKGAETILDVFERMFKSIRIHQFDALKRCGYLPSDILKVLLYLPFLGVATIRGLYHSGCANITEAEKDVYYRLKNNPWIHWRNLLFAFAKRFRKLSEQKGDRDLDTEQIRCLIIDDSTCPKRGRKLEFIGKVFDHVYRHWVLGFKALALAYWDGKSLVPLDFSLHNEKGKNKKRPYGLTRLQLKKRFSKERESKSPAVKRVRELSANKISNAIRMIKRAVKHGFMAEYVLTDSWFMVHTFIAGIRQIKNGALHVLGACRLDKRKYLFDGAEYTAKELLNKFKGQKKRSRKVRALYVELIVTYKGVPVKLFFSRYAKQKSWHLVLTTDLELSFNKAIEIYSHRWTIEVMFKEAKQHLNFGKGQANDFDSQIADITISMMQYIVLALHKRFAAYESIGALFRASKQYFLEATLAKRLWGFLLQVLQQITDLFEIDFELLMTKMLNEKELEERMFKIVQALTQSSQLAAP
ncbi:transposase [Candidatus Saccharibacteria bacterium]|nr:transposase [Candidatus Saccharibacteria bacterium]NIW78902.1 transposase [Calditrichia bacterium]